LVTKNEIIQKLVRAHYKKNTRIDRHVQDITLLQQTIRQQMDTLAEFRVESRRREDEKLQAKGVAREKLSREDLRDAQVG